LTTRVVERNVGYVTAEPSPTLAALADWRRTHDRAVLELRRERFRLIDSALAAGHAIPEIAEALGISRQAVAAFLDRRPRS
jgi:hypothetical protein